MSEPISIVEAVASIDESLAYLVDARTYLDELRSTIHDTLTSTNDVWVKRQLIALLDMADVSVKRAMR